MILDTKAEEVIRNLLSWLEQNTKKCTLYKADGTKIAESENLNFEKDADGNYITRKTNGYVVGRIFVSFHLENAYGNDITIDIAYLEDENGNKLAKSLYLGTLPAGIKDFSVVVEVAMTYIVE